LREEELLRRRRRAAETSEVEAESFIERRVLRRGKVEGDFFRSFRKEDFRYETVREVRS